MKGFTHDVVTINRDTGEIISSIPMKDSEKVSIIREYSEKQKNYLSNSSVLEMYTNDLGGYIHMTYVKNEILFGEIDIDKADICRIIYLATYLDYSDKSNNLLVKRTKHNKSEAMNVKDMQYIMNLGKTRFYKFYNNMINCGLLIKDRQDNYYLNEEYFCKGKIDKECYTRVFIDTTRDLYENSKPAQHITLSYIFQLIPYMNYNLNIICSNPNESDYRKIKKFSLKDICKILNVSTDKSSMSKFKNRLINFKVSCKGDTYSLFTWTKVENCFGLRDYFVINPKVVWRGRDIDVIKEVLEVLYCE